MLETVVGGITSENAPTFSDVLGWFLIYLAALWVAISVWVYADATKRYKNMMIAIVVTIFVFVLNFPALIVYLVIRPEEDFSLDTELAYTDQGVSGGVDVPLIKFTGENGEVKLALNLQISSSLNKDADMTLDFGVTTNREDLKISEKPVKVENKVEKLSERKEKASKESFISRTRKGVESRVNAAAAAAKKASAKVTDRAKK